MSKTRDLVGCEGGWLWLCSRRARLCGREVWRQGGKALTNAREANSAGAVLSASFSYVTRDLGLGPDVAVIALGELSRSPLSLSITSPGLRPGALIGLSRYDRSWAPRE